MDRHDHDEEVERLRAEVDDREQHLARLREKRRTSIQEAWDIRKENRALKSKTMQLEKALGVFDAAMRRANRAAGQERWTTELLDNMPAHLRSQPTNLDAILAYVKERGFPNPRPGLGKWQDAFLAAAQQFLHDPSEAHERVMHDRLAELEREAEPRTPHLHPVISRYSEALEWQIRLGREFGSEGCEPRLARVLTAANRRTLILPKTVHQSALYIGAALNDGETFYWDAERCALLMSAAQTLDDCVLTEELLPSVAGFWWFAIPLSLPEWDGDDVPLRAISWVRGWLDRSDVWSLNKGSGDARESIQLTFWTQLRGESLPLPTVFVPWNMGEGILHFLRLSDRPDRMLQEMRYVAAGLLFLNQRLLTTRTVRPDRATRKRAEKAGYEHEPLVRVIELRRKEARQRDTDEHIDVEWSCQWVVRGHWHNYHTKDGLQPRWITPYVKGPENKPLKPPRATVFAVVR